MAPSKFLTKNNLIRALPLLTSAAGRTDRWGHTRPGPGRKTKDGFMSNFWGGKKQRETHSFPSQTRSRPSEFSWDFQVSKSSFLDVRMELDDLLDLRLDGRKVSHFSSQWASPCKKSNFIEPLHNVFVFFLIVSPLIISPVADL